MSGTGEVAAVQESVPTFFVQQWEGPQGKAWRGLGGQA